MVINIDKPLGWSSTDVVRKLRTAMLRAGYPKKTKIGHAGTLDPLASGVLLICTERDTKQVEALQGQVKEYIFTLELGATTVSFDMEHPIVERRETADIRFADIELFVERLVGVQQQIPPLYSAKRINGKRAYELARAGADVSEVEIRSAEIEIFSAEMLSVEMPFVTLRVKCSKGTYIRSIARDMGDDLGCGAYLTQLRRTASGVHYAVDAITISQAESLLSQYEKPVE